MIDSEGNIVKPNYVELTQYAKKFSNLTLEKEQYLTEFSTTIIPLLPEVTERFYEILQTIPQTIPLLEGIVDGLKQTHTIWMESIFTGPYDETYTEKMYTVGEVHVRVNLPVEFMCGGITLINSEMSKLIFDIYKTDVHKLATLTSAVNSVLGFSLFIMQKSYHASVGEELEKFLLITGMSRPLFDKLASTFSGKKETSECMV